MKEDMATNEIEYRLCKFVLQNMREDGIITATEESECRLQLVKIIRPFIGVLEGGIVCENRE